MVIPLVTNLIALPLISDPRQLVRELVGTFGGNINVPDIESIAGVGRINISPGGVDPEPSGGRGGGRRHRPRGHRAPTA